MDNYKDIIVRPIITEKTMRYMDENNVVTFEVKKGTNKVLVKQAVEKIFGVDVENVNIVNVKPKEKRMGSCIYFEPRNKCNSASFSAFINLAVLQSFDIATPKTAPPSFIISSANTLKIPPEELSLLTFKSFN